MTISFAPGRVTVINIITGWQFTEVLLNDEAGEPVPAKAKRITGC
jgi:hypothetical protein